MGFSRFPPETKKRQLNDIKDCCKDNIEEWSCGCSWGCPMCYISFKCPVCRASYGYKIGLGIREGKYKPPQSLVDKLLESKS